MTTLPLQQYIANDEAGTIELKVNELRFEGGYVQRSVNGTENYTRTRTLTFINLPTASKNTLENYILERAGMHDIDYDGDVWVCKQASYNRVRMGVNIWNATVNLEEK